MLNSVNMDIARILIRTLHDKVLDDFMKVKIDESVYTIRLVEDSYGPLRINLVKKWGRLVSSDESLESKFGWSNQGEENSVDADNNQVSVMLGNGINLGKGHNSNSDVFSNPKSQDCKEAKKFSRHCKAGKGKGDDFFNEALVEVSEEGLDVKVEGVKFQPSILFPEVSIIEEFNFVDTFFKNQSKKTNAKIPLITKRVTKMKNIYEVGGAKSLKNKRWKKIIQKDVSDPISCFNDSVNHIQRI
ncbi:unnamed protein product [Vicia faba]|uniref:Uncharacterized protein n=1 Tax=Vicia faba TaxID=3906 RepID=A0AAV1B9L0_VICFA|nr:unnamed protein product [Vicia faba]